MPVADGLYMADEALATPAPGALATPSDSSASPTPPRPEEREGGQLKWVRVGWLVYVKLFSRKFLGYFGLLAKAKYHHPALLQDGVGVPSLSQPCCPLSPEQRTKLKRTTTPKRLQNQERVVR